jgi:hypothetical protein
LDFEDLYNDEPLDSNKTSKPSPEKKKREVSAQETLASAVSRVVLGLILLVSFALGCWVAATALQHPDTYWFLALGRWISEHGAVPDLEPFAWTAALEMGRGHFFVVNQWLSALISYSATLSGGLLTLLILNAVVVVTAFLSLPIGIIARRGAPFVAGLALVLLALLTAFLCPTSLTEIFSYLFIAIFLQVVHHARSAMLWHDAKVFRIAYVLVPLMVLWANLHFGFIIGLLILAGCLLGSLLGTLIGLSLAKRSSSTVSVSTEPELVPASPVIDSLVSPYALSFELAIALAGSLLASFVTPYGFKLWASIPPLLTSLSFLSGAYWPYLLLCLAFISLTLREFRACVGKPGVLGDPQVYVLVISELVTAIVVGGGAIIASFAAPSLLIFATLIVLAEVLALLGVRRLAAHADTSKRPARTFWQDLNFHSLDVWLAGGAFELAIVSFCSIAGVCLVANKVSKPELPQVGAPIKALRYIEQRKDELGVRVFNDARFGNLIDWQLRATPKVFIDTRFSVYDQKLVADYRSIENCLPGWQSLLDAYMIDWVFVAPTAKLGHALLENSGWESRYQDDRAVIFVRKKNTLHGK